MQDPETSRRLSIQSELVDHILKLIYDLFAMSDDPLPDF